MFEKEEILLELMVNRHEVFRPGGTLAERHYYSTYALSWIELYHANGTIAKTEFYRLPCHTLSSQNFYQPDGTLMMRCTYYSDGTPRQTIFYDRHGFIKKVIAFY